MVKMGKNFKTKENLKLCLPFQGYLQIMWKKKPLHTQQFFHYVEEAVIAYTAFLSTLPGRG